MGPMLNTGAQNVCRLQSAEWCSLDSRMWLVNWYPPCLEMESSCGVPGSHQSYILWSGNWKCRAVVLRTNKHFNCPHMPFCSSCLLTAWGVLTEFLYLKRIVAPTEPPTHFCMSSFLCNGSLVLFDDSPLCCSFPDIVNSFTLCLWTFSKVLPSTPKYVHSVYQEYALVLKRFFK